MVKQNKLLRDDKSYVKSICNPDELMVNIGNDYENPLNEFFVTKEFGTPYGSRSFSSFSILKKMSPVFK